MKALLNCAPSTWPSRQDPGFDPLMTTLVDRPFVQHVIEWLVQAGFDRIEVLVDGPHPALQRLLGDGTRWGVKIRVRRMPASGEFALRAMAEEIGLESGLLIGRGELLPIIDMAACRPAPRAEHPAAIFSGGEGEVARWTGWAWLTQASLRGTDRLLSPGAWQRRMQTWAGAHGCQIRAPHVLSVASCRDLLLAQRAVLGRDVAGLQIDGREIEPGVWLARGARVASGAQLHPPVYIGQHASVGSGELGPFAVVGERAVVSADTTVANAMIGAGTYVGPHLEVCDAVVRGRFLFHSRLPEGILIDDDAWLQDLEGRGAEADAEASGA